MSVTPKNQGGGTSKKTWLTPQRCFNFLDAVFHFRLDPCASDGRELCQENFTIVDDGLSKSWEDLGPVYCNPPFNRLFSTKAHGISWVEKAYREWQDHGVTSVLLIPSATCTNYFHDLCLKGKVWYMKGRISFIDKSTMEECRENPQSMMLVVFSDNDYQITDCFPTIDVKLFQG